MSVYNSTCFLGATIAKHQAGKKTHQVGSHQNSDGKDTFAELLHYIVRCCFLDKLSIEFQLVS